MTQEEHVKLALGGAMLRAALLAAEVDRLTEAVKVAEAKGSVPNPPTGATV